MKKPENWPAARVESWPLDRLKPYARNAKKHPPEQIAQLRASMREFGWTMPVLAREDGTLIAGHGRLEAAKLEGFAEAPVLVARGWTDDQCRAYAIADNRLTEIGMWDDDLLRIEIGDLKEAGFDVALTGFSATDIDRLLADQVAQALGGGAGKLAERFGVVPFSVLNAREGWWQDRKRAWLSLGIKSEVGRGENLLKFSETIIAVQNGKNPLAEKAAIVAGNGWGNGGPARRDAQFYVKKREWERLNGRAISTTEFRQKHWDGAVRG